MREPHVDRGKHITFPTPDRPQSCRSLAAGVARHGTGRRANPSASAAPATSLADEPTFTVGSTGAVDSFNPFNGIVAESYEMWALMYDYMISWSDKDMSPSGAGLADVLGDVGRRPHLDLRHSHRCEVVRRRAPDRSRHRLHATIGSSMAGRRPSPGART